MESTAEHALSVLQSNASDADVEATLGLGQLEEQVLAAKDELNLMAQMSEWKPWEGAAASPCFVLCASVYLCASLCASGFSLCVCARTRSAVCATAVCVCLAAGVAADTVVSTTEKIPNPGAFPQTMFSEGLVTEANRTAGL